jgi:hypothetical protein
MWSPSTLHELNAKKPKPAKKAVQQPSYQAKTYIAMDRDERLSLIGDILWDCGLQDTLACLIRGLDSLMARRGKSIEALCVLEGLKGLLAGYLRRYEPEEE